MKSYKLGGEVMVVFAGDAGYDEFERRATDRKVEFVEGFVPLLGRSGSESVDPCRCSIKHQ